MRGRLAQLNHTLCNVLGVGSKAIERVLALNYHVDASMRPNYVKQLNQSSLNCADIQIYLLSSTTTTVQSNASSFKYIEMISNWMFLNTKISVKSSLQSVILN